MTNPSKVEHSKTKNEEIASLVEQQVEDVVDPFASTFSALWGAPLSPESRADFSKYVDAQNNTCLNLDNKDISVDSSENQLLQIPQEINEGLPLNFKQVQNKTRTKLDINANSDKKNNLKIQTSKKFTFPYEHSLIALSPISQNILKIINQVNNFALIGFITLLNIIYPKGEGPYSINGLARITGMSRTSIRGNLQNLESFGLITLIGDKISISQICQQWLNTNGMDKYDHEQINTHNVGNILKLTHEQIKTYEQDSGSSSVYAQPRTNANMYKNESLPESSSCLNEKDTTTNKELNGSNGLKLDMSKFRHMPPWEKAKVSSYADDLFYLAITTKLEVETLSMQTLNLYKRILQEHDRYYAAALFLLLLPKAKDNPTGYILSAYRQGAEPTTGALLKIKEILDISDNLFNNFSSKDIKLKIQNALEKDDSESIMLLTQMQLKIKTALKSLSWLGTVETLKEKHDSFIKTLLGE